MNNRLSDGVECLILKGLNQIAQVLFLSFSLSPSFLRQSFSHSFSSLLLFFYRLLVGSTSRYCVDHAPCNVLVIKNPHESQPAGIKYHNNPPSPSILLFSLSHLSPFLLSHLLFTALISASLSMAPGDEGVLEAEMLTITEHRS